MNANTGTLGGLMVTTSGRLRRDAMKRATKEGDWYEYYSKDVIKFKGRYEDGRPTGQHQLFPSKWNLFVAQHFKYDG